MSQTNNWKRTFLSILYRLPALVEDNHLKKCMAYKRVDITGHSTKGLNGCAMLGQSGKELV